MKAPVEDFLLREGATLPQIRLVIGELVPAMWKMQQSEQAAEVKPSNIDSRVPLGADQASMNQGVEPDVERVLGALSRSGMVFDNHQEWFGVALRPTMQANVRYIQEGERKGDLHKGDTIIELEKIYGEEAENIYEEVLLPMAAMSRSLNGRRTGLEVAEDTQKWIKHWRGE